MAISKKPTLREVVEKHARDTGHGDMVPEDISQVVRQGKAEAKKKQIAAALRQVKKVNLSVPLSKSDTEESAASQTPTDAIQVKTSLIGVLKQIHVDLEDIVQIEKDILESKTVKKLTVKQQKKVSKSQSVPEKKPSVSGLADLIKKHPLLLISGTLGLLASNILGWPDEAEASIKRDIDKWPSDAAEIIRKETESGIIAPSVPEEAPSQTVPPLPEASKPAPPKIPARPSVPSVPGEAAPPTAPTVTPAPRVPEPPKKTDAIAVIKPSVSTNKPTRVDAQNVVEKYLGKSVTEGEYEALIRATHAEAHWDGNPTELVMVMASILNRARTHRGGIIGALHDENAFQAVTGTVKKRGPSALYLQGPNAVRREAIERAAINYLEKVSREQKHFAAGDDAAYGPGTSTKWRDELLAKGGKRYGHTVFNTQADWLKKTPDTGEKLSKSSRELEDQEETFSFLRQTTIINAPRQINNHYVINR